MVSSRQLRGEEETVWRQEKKRYTPGIMGMMWWQVLTYFSVCLRYKIDSRLFGSGVLENNKNAILGYGNGLWCRYTYWTYFTNSFPLLFPLIVSAALTSINWPLTRILLGSGRPVRTARGRAWGTTAVITNRSDHPQRGFRLVGTLLRRPFHYGDNHEESRSRPTDIPNSKGIS